MQTTSRLLAAGAMISGLCGLATLSSCHAFVGSFELEGQEAGAGDATTDTTSADGATDVATDTATDVATDTAVDTASDSGGPDTGGPDVADAAPKPISSCKQFLDANPGTKDGPQTLTFSTGRASTFCDMNNGGYTLVALRKSTSPGTAWRNESGVLKVVPHPTTAPRLDPFDPEDRVLDVDWTEIGFTEVLYDLGITMPGIMGQPPGTGSRVTLTGLTTAQQKDARAALGKTFVNPDDRPACTFGMFYAHCYPPPAMPAPGDPDAALGWVYSPSANNGGSVCYWASEITTDAGVALGSTNCTSGAVGRARVWVK